MIIDEFKNLIRGKASREGGSRKNLIRFPRINWQRIAVESIFMFYVVVVCVRERGYTHTENHSL